MNQEAVRVENLTVQFGDFTAVNHISFRVNKGEIFGFLGANGAGKTTTIRVLCGLLVPTSGDVFVPGKSNVGYMSQKFTLYNDLTVGENLDFIASLRKLDKATYLNHRDELFNFISFDKPIKTMVQDLPSGLKQQVSLIAALLHNPEIIFLDEPTAGVSPRSRERFWSLIKKLAKQGKTIFVTTHYMDEAEQCERIALMRDGKIIALDSPDGLKLNAFEGPVLEFDPKKNLTFEEILAMNQEPIFSFFEPYGLRFHASLKDLTQWEKERPRFETRFHIRSIKPSLEDVFIKLVESKNP